MFPVNITLTKTYVKSEDRLSWPETNVTHTSESAIPFASTGIGPTIYTTEIEKGGNTYSGSGWTKEGGDKEAGEKYNSGEPDKK